MLGGCPEQSAGDRFGGRRDGRDDERRPCTSRAPKKLAWDLTSVGDSVCTMEPSRAEPSRARAEPSRAEPSRAEPSRAEPSRAEPSRAEPSRAEPSRAEPSRAEPSRAEPSRAEPSRAEPSRAEPSRAEPSRAVESGRAPGNPDYLNCRPAPSAAKFCAKSLFISRTAWPRPGVTLPSIRRKIRFGETNPRGTDPAHHEFALRVALALRPACDPVHPYARILASRSLP